MQTINKFNQQASTPDMGQILKCAGLNVASELNCMKIGIVQEFYPDDLTVQVRIASKKPIDAVHIKNEVLPCFSSCFTSVIPFPPFRD